MDEHLGLPFFYFDVAHALRTQQWVIDNSGGLHGVKNVAQLESVLGHIQKDLYYPEMSDKLTHLVYSVNKNHPFNDGNKRSSIALGAYFLELNGYDFAVKRFVLEMENIAVYVADNVIGIRAGCRAPVAGPVAKAQCPVGREGPETLRSALQPRCAGC